MGTSTLPDGFVVVVKRECETCRMVVPVLAQLHAIETLTVYTQDDPDFPERPRAIHDADLALSWHHEIETVPTLIRVEDGREVARTVGWLRTEWEDITGIFGLGLDLPPMRPGCGSISVDPDRVDELRAIHDGNVLRSRRIEIADAEDEFELDVPARLDRRPARRPAHRRARAAHAHRHHPGARRGGRHRAARPGRHHGREGRGSRR